MKLEVGQVWRRPDGTRWRVERVRPLGHDHVAELAALDKMPALPELNGRSITGLELPARAVLEGWSRVSE